MRVAPLAVTAVVAAFVLGATVAPARLPESELVAAGVACDSDGVAVDLDADFVTGAYRVGAVTISDIDSACVGEPLVITLLQGTTSLGVGGPLAVTGMAMGVPIVPSARAEDVTDVHLEIGTAAPPGGGGSGGAPTPTPTPTLAPTPTPTPSSTPRPSPSPSTSPLRCVPGVSGPRLDDPLGWYLAGTPGDDELRGTLGPDFICTFAGDDVVNALAGSDRVSGGRNADTLHAGFDNDQVFGWAGNDFLYASNGNDVAIGGHGSDGIWGGKGDDKLRGLYGPDTVRGGSGADEVRGGSGDDVLYGGPGADEVSGGRGHDICYVDRADSHSKCEDVRR